MEKLHKGLFACFLVFTLATVSVSAQTNPGFENGLTGWSTFNFAFVKGTGTGNSGNLASGSPHGGLNVLQLFGPFVSNWDASGASQNIAISAGQTLTLSGWGMNPSGDAMSLAGSGFGELQIVWLDAGNATISAIDGNHIDKTAGLQDQWQALIASGVAPVGTVSANVLALHVNGPDNSGGSAYFDDLAVVIPEPSSIALALVGLLGFVTVLRKRRV